MNKKCSTTRIGQQVAPSRNTISWPGIAALFSLGLACPGWLFAQALPQDDSREHLGVKSCSASTCHGSITERSSYSVLQNEYQTWTRHDRHSRAYETLLSERSQRIARNLGLAKAHEAKVCLDCHADNIAVARRGRFFNLSDGVGCEACHGGAEEWLGPHISAAASHDKNLAAGMYPTDEPATRATLCLSCHLGTESKFANHRIMGAGHPRLTFELATFTKLQPAHYKKDADYLQRKNFVSGPDEWLEGLLVGADQNLALIQYHYDTEGPFPEFALFDCFSCHHSFEQLRWQASELLGENEPGTVRLEDSRLRMVALLEQQVLQSTSTSEGLRNMHTSTLTSPNDLTSAAVELRRRLAALAPRLRQHLATGNSDHFKTAIHKAATMLRFNDYADAEQAAMALQVLDKTESADPALKALFDALSQPDSYDPKQVALALANPAGAKTGHVGQNDDRAALAAPNEHRLHVVNVGALRVRETPSLSGAAVAWLAAGDKVIVQKVSGSWSYVSSGDALQESLGWVGSRFLDAADP